MTCGGTVSENCTYIQNEGYDTAYDPGAVTETCVVSLCKVEEYLGYLHDISLGTKHDWQDVRLNPREAIYSVFESFENNAAQE